jgi:hypothetical protein
MGNSLIAVPVEVGKATQIICAFEMLENSKGVKSSREVKNLNEKGLFYEQIFPYST